MLTGWRKTVSKCFIIPQRVVLSIMGFLAVVNAYTMRICLNLAITEMVIKKESGVDDDDKPKYCIPANVTGTEKPSLGEYDWSEEMQGLILGAFFIGYFLTHIPGGMLAEKFGGKYTLSLGILSTAIFTLLTPLTIRTGGPIALIVLRVLEGAGEGTTFPALSALLACWIPLKERSKLGSFVFGGGQIGTILGTLLSGYLIHWFESWDSVFYFFGICGILWFIIFTMICYKDPESHPFIKESEKDFLRKEMGTLTRNKELPLTPWRAIIVNVPMLALIAAQIGHDFGFFIMATDLPKYMSDVLKFSIKDNGLYSSIPYLAMWVVSIGLGFVSDWMIVNNYITITNARKLWTSVASFFPACFIIAASYAGCDKTLVIVLFTLAMGTMGGFYPGMKVNALDLSPNYAGSLMALTNGIGATTGFIGPFLVGVIATDSSSVTQWRTVFWIAFGIFNITNIIYIVWASAEIQPFNDGAVPLKNKMDSEDNSSNSENDDFNQRKAIEPLRTDSLKN